MALASAMLGVHGLHSAKLLGGPPIRECTEVTSRAPWARSPQLHNVGPQAPLRCCMASPGASHRPLAQPLASVTQQRLPPSLRSRSPFASPPTTRCVTYGPPAFVIAVGTAAQKP